MPRARLQILRTKRGAGNKENDAQAENNGGQGGARKRERNRRVSFAPDDELQTMHLYPKVRAAMLHKPYAQCSMQRAAG